MGKTHTTFVCTLHLRKLRDCKEKLFPVHLSASEPGKQESIQHSYIKLAGKAQVPPDVEEVKWHLQLGQTSPGWGRTRPTVPRIIVRKLMGADERKIADLIYLTFKENFPSWFESRLQQKVDYVIVDNFFSSVKWKWCFIFFLA